MAALLYTSPAGVFTQIVALGAVNTDTATHQVTIYIVPSSVAVSAASVTTNAYAILPSANYNGQNEYGMVLRPSDAIWALADTANVVNILASGLLNT